MMMSGSGSVPDSENHQLNILSSEPETIQCDSPMFPKQNGHVQLERRNTEQPAGTITRVQEQDNFLIHKLSEREDSEGGESE